MALHYTMKKEDRKEKDVPAEEFANLMVKLKRTPEEVRKIDNIESTK